MKNYLNAEKNIFYIFLLALQKQGKSATF